MVRSSFLLGVFGFGLALTAACGQGRGPDAPRVVATAPTAAPPPASKCARSADAAVSPEILDALAMLATDKPRPASDRSVVKQAELDAYIARLVDDDRFAHDVAPRMIAGPIVEYAGGLEYPTVLSVDDSSGTPIYFIGLRGKCKPEQAVDVHPWWAIDSTVKVCESAYKPNGLRPTSKEPGRYCGPNPDPTCGCGPNLVFCARNRPQKDELIKSTQEEAIRLIARTVKTDARLDQVWTANETERDRNAELIYRRWRISAGEPAEPLLQELKTWPTTPVLRPRYEQSPRQHAGLFTFSGSLGLEASIRARMKWFYQSLWCDEPPAGSVETQAVLSFAKSGNVRNGAGWQELASRPICTECHARLDYGGQFFSGFGINWAYDPKEHASGEGKLYAKNIDDFRGKGSLDPRTFGELATAQPEFSSCVVKHVKRRVLDDVFDTTYDDALSSAFAERHSLKSLMKVALRAYADQRLADGCKTGDRRSSETLEHAFDTYCRACHGPNGQKPDFANLSDPGALKAALSAVAFGKMPRSPIAMPTEHRRAFAELLVQRIWSDDATRARARAYFENARPAPVHGMPGVLDLIDTRAGAEGRALFKDPKELDENTVRGDLLRYVPGVESIISLEAYSACKAAGRHGADLDACYLRATDLNGTVRTNVTGK